MSSDRVDATGPRATSEHLVRDVCSAHAFAPSHSPLEARAGGPGDGDAVVNIVCATRPATSAFQRFAGRRRSTGNRELSRTRKPGTGATDRVATPRMPTPPNNHDAASHDRHDPPRMPTSTRSRSAPPLPLSILPKFRARQLPGLRERWGGAPYPRISTESVWRSRESVCRLHTREGDWSAYETALKGATMQLWTTHEPRLARPAPQVCSHGSCTRG
jgi:hypothetical protein